MSSEDLDEDLLKTHHTLQQYFNAPCEVKPVSSPEESKKLSLNELSREQLAALSKEELIELLATSSKNKKQRKSPSKKPRSRTVVARSHIRRVQEAKIAAESTQILTTSNDSQSEHRNSKVITNPLPPEQEERETPHSEPESDEEHTRKKQATDGLTSCDSTTDMFDDICTIEKSVSENTEEDLLPEEKIEPVKNTNEEKNNGESNILTSNSNSSIKKNQKKKLEKKSKNPRRPGKKKKKTLSAGGIEGSNGIMDSQVEQAKGVCDGIIKGEVGTKEIVDNIEKEQPETSEETDDSYDVDEEISASSFPFECESEENTHILSKKHSKTVSHLLEMVSDGDCVPIPVGTKDDIFVTRQDTIEDPRRYLELGKTANLSQKALVGKKIESVTALKIKENLKAQQLRRFISVGSGLDNRIVRDQLKLKQAESPSASPLGLSPQTSDATDN